MEQAVAAVGSGATPRRAPWWVRFTSIDSFIAGVVFAIVQWITALSLGVVPNEIDFPIFLQATERFLRGARMYSSEATDFTPPLFHILLIPLTGLVPWLGYVIWTVANVALACIVVRLVLRAEPDAARRHWTILAWIANAAGVHLALRLGQVSWIVALPVTLAWLCARAGRGTASGAWCGVAVFLKPFLLLALPVFVVRRQWSALAGAVAVIAACLIASIALFGWHAFTDWLLNLRQTPDPTYVQHFMNASWHGFVARAGAPYVVGLLLGLVTIAVTLGRVRSMDEDETWLLLGVTALLASPLGWMYYQPLLIGPAVALAVAGRLSGVRWVLLTAVVPALSGRQFQDGSALVAMSIGSVYLWGLLGLWTWLICRPLDRGCAK